VINTGINSCWLLIHLAAHPDWLAKVHAEVSSLITKYTDPTSQEPLHKRLGAIPPQGWEEELPVLDLCLRETLRVSNNNTLLRRNVADNIPIANEKQRMEEKTLERGVFMAYPTDDVHLNPEIYTNPLIFDPDRYAPGREEDKRVPLGYVAWGAGRHPCAGMRVAKLEIKLIVVMFLKAYQYELVDKNDKFPDPFPAPDRNDYMQVS
jgi:cytochrome P450